MGVQAGLPGLRCMAQLPLPRGSDHCCSVLDVTPRRGVVWRAASTGAPWVGWSSGLEPMRSTAQPTTPATPDLLVGPCGWALPVGAALQGDRTRTWDPERDTWGE